MLIQISCGQGNMLPKRENVSCSWKEWSTCTPVITSCAAGVTVAQCETYSSLCKLPSKWPLQKEKPVTQSSSTQPILEHLHWTMPCHLVMFCRCEFSVLQYILQPPCYQLVEDCGSPLQECNPDLGVALCQKAGAMTRSDICMVWSES